MFPSSKNQVICLLLILQFLRVVSFHHDCAMEFSEVSWPDIPTTDTDIGIDTCHNLGSIPAFAASDRPDLRSMVLLGNTISQINETWIQNSPNIVSVWLPSNKLTSIPSLNCGPTGSEGCPKLREISLADNLITYVPARSFANHSKLQLLNIDNNAITILADLWIVDCPSLANIELSGNSNLTSFLVTKDSGLADLLTLTLHDCNIGSLDPYFLHLFPTLDSLTIYGNPINTLPKFVASHPIKVRVASMGNFVCDCNAVKLAQNGKIDSANEAGFCGSPDYNVHKSFAQLKCKEASRAFRIIAANNSEVQILERSSVNGDVCIDLAEHGRFRLEDDHVNGWMDADVIMVEIQGRRLRCGERIDAAIEMSTFSNGQQMIPILAKCKLLAANFSACSFRCICRQSSLLCGPICLVNVASSMSSLCFISLTQP